MLMYTTEAEPALCGMALEASLALQGCAAALCKQYLDRKRWTPLGSSRLISDQMAHDTGTGVP